MYVFFSVIQLLQGKSIPKLGSLDQIETGSGDVEGHYSGDCDDEDGCGGSGGGEVKRKVSRVFKSKSFFSLLFCNLSEQYIKSLCYYLINTVDHTALMEIMK